MSSDLTDRARGCLLGLACGDALGGPVEFKSRSEIAKRFPDGVRDFVGGGWLSLAPGEITDDTQMTLEIARSLATGSCDMADFATRFVAWADGGPKDIGNLTRSAISLLPRGLPWDEAGAQALVGAAGRGAGNGSVMRCAPIALRYHNDVEHLRAVSIDTSRITHADPRCTAGSVAVNQAIAHLLHGGSRHQVLAAAIDGVDEPETVEAAVRAASIDKAAVRSGGFVLDSVTAAFWALLHHDSFEETVVAAVSLGDDADTTGAVTGALAGAQYGANAIPARWLDLLQPRDELTSLADKLIALAGS